MQLVMFGFKIKIWKPVNESSKVTQSLMEQKQERLLSDIFSYIYDDCIWESYLVLKSLDLWTTLGMHFLPASYSLKTNIYCSNI